MEKDSNLRRQNRLIYSQGRLTTSLSIQIEFYTSIKLSCRAVYQDLNLESSFVCLPEFEYDALPLSYTCHSRIILLQSKWVLGLHSDHILRSYFAVRQLSWLNQEEHYLLPLSRKVPVLTLYDESRILLHRLRMNNSEALGSYVILRWQTLLICITEYFYSGQYKN